MNFILGKKLTAYSKTTTIIRIIMPKAKEQRIILLKIEVNKPISHDSCSYFKYKKKLAEISGFKK